MILGYRAINRPHFHGINIFLLKDFLVPMEQVGHTCFDAFDEALLKLKNDSEATRIYSIDSKSPEVTAFNTATEAALRAVPERYRSSTELYTLVQSTSRSNLVYARLPTWAFLSCETQSGELFSLRLDSTGAKRSWYEIPLEPEDRFVHIKLFSESEYPAIAPLQDREEFFRLADIALVPKSSQKISPLLSISLIDFANSEEALNV